MPANPLFTPRRRVKRRTRSAGSATAPPEQMPMDADSALRNLAGSILAAAELHPDDDRIKRLSEYVMQLIAGDPQLIKSLLIEVAKLQNESSSFVRPNPFIEAMMARGIEKVQAPRPAAPATPPVNNDEIIAQAKAILKQMEDKNASEKHGQQQPEPGTAVSPTDPAIGTTEQPVS